MIKVYIVGCEFVRKGLCVFTFPFTGSVFIVTQRLLRDIPKNGCRRPAQENWRQPKKTST